MISQGPTKRFYGKYRGSVESIADPERRGRVTLKVPDVLGKQTSTWAEPCVPLAGPTGFPMGVFFVPPERTAVWVEFEGGDTNHPIWVGCIWAGDGGAGLPGQAYRGLEGSPSVVMQTRGRNSLVISDGPAPDGGITLASASGARISINEAGITIVSADGARIELASGKVNVNRGALEVT
jgi:uncharacterized protein involved in type VI secretion and phage assembly